MAILLCQVVGRSIFSNPLQIVLTVGAAPAIERVAPSPRRHPTSLCWPTAPTSRRSRPATGSPPTSKVNGKPGALGDVVSVARDKTKISVTANDSAFSKRLSWMKMKIDASIYWNTITQHQRTLHRLIWCYFCISYSITEIL